MIMQNKKSFSWAARFKSFTYAWAGIKAVLRTEHNAQIHLVLSIAVVIAGFLLRISLTEAALLVIAMAFVWMAEIFNTAIEKAMDFISTEKHPQIGLVKDLAAAAVLVAAIAAVVIGALVFIPKLF